MLQFEAYAGRKQDVQITQFPMAIPINARLVGRHTHGVVMLKKVAIYTKAFYSFMPLHVPTAYFVDV